MDATAAAAAAAGGAARATRRRDATGRIHVERAGEREHGSAAPAAAAARDVAVGAVDVGVAAVRAVRGDARARADNQTCQRTRRRAEHDETAAGAAVPGAGARAAAASRARNRARRRAVPVRRSSARDGPVCPGRRVFGAIGGELAIRGKPVPADAAVASAAARA